MGNDQGGGRKRAEAIKCVSNETGLSRLIISSSHDLVRSVDVTITTNLETGLTFVQVKV